MAPKAVEATMRAREVQTYCAEIEGTVAGLAMALCREERGRIPFIHVLKPYLGKGIEERLLREAVNPLRAGGVTAIASECIPFCDIDLRTPFLAMGFQVFPRQLMLAETQLLSNMGTGVFRSAPCGPLDIRGAAECIAAAYANHGERILHAEVQHADSAGEYIRPTCGATVRHAPSTSVSYGNTTGSRAPYWDAKRHQRLVSSCRWQCGRTHKTMDWERRSSASWPRVSSSGASIGPPSA